MPWWRIVGGTALLAASVLSPRTARGQTTPPVPDLAGTWRGSLVNLPVRPNAPTVSVTREIGAFPTGNGQCTPWRTTYAERDTVRGVKDYRLCRGSGAGDLYLDEGGGVRLAVQLLGDVLVSAFKVGPLLLTSQVRVRGDQLEEEIVTIADAPATEGLVTLTARGVQRLTLTRVR
jgi:hypothetical protein